MAIILALIMTLACAMPAGVFALPDTGTDTLPQNTVTEAGSADEETAPVDTDAALNDTDAASNKMTALNASDDIHSIVNSMSRRQKIAQCLMMDFRKWNDAGGTPQDMTVLSDGVAGIIADYQFGAVILFAENIKENGETLRLTKAMQSAVQSKGGLPLLVATDQEGGIVNRLGSGTALPGNMALCATGDPENAKTAGRIIGSEVRSLGINTTLAPVLDVNINAENPIIGLRSFSDDPDKVGTFGKAYISGLREEDVIGCAKHYPGHGDTSEDSHMRMPRVDKSKAELEKTELKPFRIAIDQGVDMIMTAHILFPQVDNTTIHSEKTGNDEPRPATMSSIFLKNIIRGEMGFDGVIVTDAMNMEGITKHFGESQAAAEALNSGADLICMPVTGVYDESQLRERLESVITYIDNSITDERLNEAVTRVLTLKKKNKILDYDEQDYSEEEAYSTVGSAEHRRLEREIAAKAVTVVRNENDTLPYKAGGGAKILMMSAYRDESAQMVMGFNRAKQAGMLPPDAEVRVFDFQKYTGGIEGDLKADLDWADLVIIDSELYGKDDMAYDEGQWRSLVPLAATKYCRANGKKSVIMSINTPYDVQLYPDADAMLAVYGWVGSSVDVNEAIEKGITESEKACGPNIAAGIEVLFGVFGASGRLPVDIPVFDSSSKSYTDRVAYARDFGLTYDKQEPGKTYNIVYKLSGGSYKGSSEDIVENYWQNTSISVHEAPVRDGYEFLYWKGSEYKPGDKYTVTEDHVFTAQWRKVSGPAGGSKTNTGDDSSLALWFVLLLTSLLGITGAAIVRKR